MRPKEITDEDIEFLLERLKSEKEYEDQHRARKISILLNSWKETQIVSDRDYSGMTGNSPFELILSDKKGKPTDFALRLSDGKNIIPFTTKHLPAISTFNKTFYPMPQYKRGQIVADMGGASYLMLDVSRFASPEDGWKYEAIRLSRRQRDEINESRMRYVGKWDFILSELAPVIDPSTVIRIGKLMEAKKSASEFLLTEDEIQVILNGIV